MSKPISKYEKEVMDRIDQIRINQGYSMEEFSEYLGIDLETYKRSKYKQIRVDLDFLHAVVTKFPADLENLLFGKTGPNYKLINTFVSGTDEDRAQVFDELARFFRCNKDIRVGFYNDLYTFIDRYLNNEYTAFGGPLTEDSSDNEVVEKSEHPDEITDDVIKQWAAYDFEVVYDSPDGREYALVPIDRALGSSFYVLLVFNEKGNPDSAELVNSDPFNQHGGEAKFISFLNDGKTGFAALSYSGGSEGLLFETLDGGKSYQEIILPSPKIELPTGEFYNPFVMPEEAWEESDTIYLKISQGIDGDHHSEKLGGARTVGIYASYDNGKTFEFVREEAEPEEE